MIAIEIVAAALTVVLVALPARGVIGRNGIAGIRTRATMRSDENWLLGHRAAVVPTSIAGGATVVVGLVSVGLGRADDVPAFVACAVTSSAGRSGAWSPQAARPDDGQEARGGAASGLQTVRWSRDDLHPRGHLGAQHRRAGHPGV